MLPARLVCLLSFTLLHKVAGAALQTVPLCQGLSLDILPPAQRAQQPAPVVLVVHGGGWIGGSRQDYPELLQWLSQQGYVAAAAEYRLAPAARFPAQIEDMKCVLGWLQQHAEQYGGDSKRMAGIGISAGAHLLALSQTTPGQWETQKNAPLRCAALHGAPLDLPAWWQSADPDRQDMMSPRVMLKALTGAAYPQAASLYRQASPQWQLEQRHAAASHNVRLPALLLIHGEQDQTVPLQQSQRYAARYQQAGGRAELYALPDTGHIGFGTHGRSVAEKLRQFLQSCTK